MKQVVALLLIFTAPAWGVEWPTPVNDDDYRKISRAEAELGQLLFYDPIISGNKNIACATCHHPRFATGDGVSLSLGEGGVGLGPGRRADPKNPPEQRIPRHSQTLFNLGAHEFTALFHDGKIEVDPSKSGGLRTPLGGEMTRGFTSILSAQTMFPVISPDEMAGHYSENDVAQAVRQGRITGAGGAWNIIAARVAQIPEYLSIFQSVYAGIETAEDVEFTDISNAIAAFVAYEWRSDKSEFDAVLRGEARLAPRARSGAELFYGKAGCATCHAGRFQTDHRFHAMGVPQFGPGKAARFETHARDTGRMRVTGREADAFAFRTPSLRNVTATSPYGHTGAYRDLRSFITAHMNGARALVEYDRSSAILPVFTAEDWRILDDPNERDLIADASYDSQVKLNGEDVEKIIRFLEALEDPTALSGRLGIPNSVPSGLPVDR